MIGGLGDNITYSTIEAFVANCPKLTCLTLKGFNLDDAMAQILVKVWLLKFYFRISFSLHLVLHVLYKTNIGIVLQGLLKLKYVNLSSTSGIHGSFLRLVFV